MAYMIQDEYESSFSKFLDSTHYDCPKIVDLVVQKIPGFRDEAIYNGEQVFFYKRAQILCADLIGAMDDYGSDIKFVNSQSLTMFADYRVPQILRHVGIFEYENTLADMVDKEIEMPYSSPEEVQIRAATVMAVEQIMAKIRASETLSPVIKNSYEVDWLLWQMGERQLGEMKPHHKVLSIFY